MKGKNFSPLEGQRKGEYMSRSRMGMKMQRRRREKTLMRHFHYQAGQKANDKATKKGEMKWRGGGKKKLNGKEKMARGQ